MARITKAYVCFECFPYYILLLLLVGRWKTSAAGRMQKIFYPANLLTGSGMLCRPNCTKSQSLFCLALTLSAYLCTSGEVLAFSANVCCAARCVDAVCKGA